MRKPSILALVLVVSILAWPVAASALPQTAEEMSRADVWAMLLMVRGDILENELGKVREAMFDDAGVHDMQPVIDETNKAMESLADPEGYQLAEEDYPAEERERYQAFLDRAKEEYRRAALMIQVIARTIGDKSVGFLVQVTLHELAQVHLDNATFVLWTLGQAQGRDR
ncbi:MAG: hypothetical protein VB144_15200 [Clostridia bacterium]|nr:hypothetical protein [Clostridia bacterium]